MMILTKFRHWFNIYNNLNTQMSLYQIKTLIITQQFFKYEIYKHTLRIWLRMKKKYYWENVLWYSFTEWHCPDLVTTYL